MTQIPELRTERLKLRGFTLQDAPAVTELCSEWDIAATVASIPHPYEQSMAEEWIGTHQEAFQQGKAVAFAVTTIDEERLVGAIDIHINATHHLGEVGYWIGKPFWNRGYATEALKAVIGYAFKTLHLNRVQARHMTKNPASGRVMEKAGMQNEGVLRQSLYRWESFEDAAMYSILREGYEARE